MNDIVTNGLPDGVPLVAPFDHQFNRLSYYYDLIPATVNQPETGFFDLSSENGVPSFDEHAVAHWMRDKRYEKTFVRSDFSSAKVHPEEGSFITQPTVDVIRDTVANLIRDHIIQDRSTGGTLAVREPLDLDYCTLTDPTHSHLTEVRYFLRSGEVHRPQTEDDWVRSHEKCHLTYDYIDTDTVSFPDEQAERVASVFDTFAWSVDFARTTHGEWYCIDMGLDGLYWIEETDSWHEISGHGDDRLGLNPANYTDEMPEAPKDLSNWEQ